MKKFFKGIAITLIVYGIIFILVKFAGGGNRPNFWFKLYLLSTYYGLPLGVITSFVGSITKKKIMLFIPFAITVIILVIVNIKNYTSSPPESEREIIGYPSQFSRGNSYTDLFGREYYFKHKGSVYYHYDSCGFDSCDKGDVELKNSDPDTFKIIDSNFAKDKNYVYYWGRVVNKADPATFEPLDWPNAKDKNYYYSQTEITGKVE